MSDSISHECGIAVIRLLKPLSYYEQKYNTPLYGFNKLFLLMEKQHNRGQDGAGIGAVKLRMPPGQEYMFRDRETTSNGLLPLFQRHLAEYDTLTRTGEILPGFGETVKQHFDYGAEVLLGHLRYGTSGAYVKNACHPYIKRSNWPTKSLMLAGNFNMTNAAELNERMIRRGQHPIFDTDTNTILGALGFNLDEEHDRIYHQMRDSGVRPEDIPQYISENLDLKLVLSEAVKHWDGGYTLAGMVGNGDCFVTRDPHGIRPCHWFVDDEVVALASERVPLMTIFGKKAEDIREVTPGSAVIIRQNGEIQEEQIQPAGRRTECSFERIYFSRGNDPKIYRERKALGKALVPKLMRMLDGDLQNTVFSYVPNTAETAYYGLIDALNQYRQQEVKRSILEAQRNGGLTEERLNELILDNWPRQEKIAHKDIKLRTFISQEEGRSKLVSHVYDITYGVVEQRDTLVVLDDSIVRGTTLRESIIRILSRTQPRRIIIASTAPQIRYPDCYGIDMSELGKFVAFQAAISLLSKRGMGDLAKRVYHSCQEQLTLRPEEMTNPVKRIYEPFSPEEISAEITRIVYPKDLEWKGTMDIVFQSIGALHEACPDNTGDWYFTGDYPTPGGNAVVNQAFINYFENRVGRSYDLPSAKGKKKADKQMSPLIRE